MRGIDRTIVLLTATTMLGIGGLRLYEIYRQPDLVASILKLAAPPASMRVSDCESPLTTDVLTTCSISIDPAEFPLLLKGYAFEETAVQGTSHTATATTVGTEFPITTEYRVEPKEFVYGGFVRVLTNGAKHEAIVDLYIE